MKLKILHRVILLVNLSRSRDLFDTEEARNEWQLLSSGNYNLSLFNIPFYFKLQTISLESGTKPSHSSLPVWRMRQSDLFKFCSSHSETKFVMIPDSGEREVAPPQYMLHMYEKYARLEERGHASRTPVIRSILPCNGELPVNCHQQTST